MPAHIRVCSRIVSRAQKNYAQIRIRVNRLNKRSPKHIIMPPWLPQGHGADLVMIFFKIIAFFKHGISPDPRQPTDNDPGWFSCCMGINNTYHSINHHPSGVNSTGPSKSTDAGPYLSFDIKPTMEKKFLTKGVLSIMPRFYTGCACFDYGIYIACLLTAQGKYEEHQKETDLSRSPSFFFLRFGSDRVCDLKMCLVYKIYVHSHRDYFLQ